MKLASICMPAQAFCWGEGGFIPLIPRLSAGEKEGSYLSFPGFLLGRRRVHTSHSQAFCWGEGGFIPLIPRLSAGEKEGSYLSFSGFLLGRRRVHTSHSQAFCWGEGGFIPLILRLSAGEKEGSYLRLSAGEKEGSYLSFPGFLLGRRRVHTSHSQAFCWGEGGFIPLIPRLSAGEKEGSYLSFSGFLLGTRGFIPLILRFSAGEKGGSYLSFSGFHHLSLVKTLGALSTSLIIVLHPPLLSLVSIPGEVATDLVQLKTLKVCHNKLGKAEAEFNKFITSAPV